MSDDWTHIWLEHKDAELTPEGRSWCDHDAWGDGAVEYIRADIAAARIAELEAEVALLRILLNALDAYARGEPSQPPMTGVEKRTALLCQFDDAMRNLSQGMEPLDPEFQAAISSDREGLYSDDPLP
jgi:hypothetical protein